MKIFVFEASATVSSVAGPVTDGDVRKTSEMQGPVTGDVPRKELMEPQS